MAKKTCRDSKGRFRKAGSASCATKRRKSRKSRSSGKPIALPSSGPVGTVATGRDGEVWRVALNAAGHRYWVPGDNIAAVADAPAVVGKIQPQTKACAMGSKGRSHYRTPKVAPGCVLPGTRMRGNDNREYIVCGDKAGQPRWFLLKNAPCLKDANANAAAIQRNRDADFLATVKGAKVVPPKAGDYKPLLQQQMLPVEGGWAPIPKAAPALKYGGYAVPAVKRSSMSPMAPVAPSLKYSGYKVSKNPISDKSAAALGMGGALAAAAGAGALLSNAGGSYVSPGTLEIGGGPAGLLDGAKEALAPQLAAGVPAVGATFTPQQQMKPLGTVLQMAAGGGAAGPGAGAGNNIAGPVNAGNLAAY